MLTSVRSLMAATILAGSVLVSAPALADDEAASSSGLSVSGSVTLVTDYRFRGVSLSAGDPAIQGGISVSHSSGFYVGAWSSSIAGGSLFGQQELDLYGGWSGDVASGVKVDVGLLKYVYPSSSTGGADYWEPYGSVSGSLGPVSAKLGVAYAWDQASLGNDHNFYIYNELGVAIPSTPISLSTHIGYTDGVLSPKIIAGGTSRSGWDWSIGASATVLGKLTVGVSYIGTDAPSVQALGTDDTVVGTLSVGF